MHSRKHGEITWRDPLGSETEPWRPDLLLPSLFVSAASLMLAIIDPIHIAYQPRPVLTIIAVLSGVVVVWWGTMRGRVRVVFAGVGLLLSLVALCLITQPAQLGAAMATVWPLRVGLLLLVAVAWAFLMSPPLWARRALTAFTAITGSLLVVVGGPPLANQLFGWSTPPDPHFAPNWLTVDSRGTLYATSALGHYLWVFDRTGTPVGTIWPGLASDGGKAGPGIIPAADRDPSAREVASAFRLVVPTPVPFGTEPPPPFNFCGVAVDAHDRLYIADLSKQLLLQFDSRGIATARWPLPPSYSPSRGCLAADDRHVYLGSRFGLVYFYDLQGEIVREVELGYEPNGLALDEKGNLIAMGVRQARRIDTSTGEMTPFSLPSLPDQVQSPYQSIVVNENGEMLVTDFPSNSVIRISSDGSEILSTMGGRGFLPGQFQAPAGLALGPGGQIYVADWQAAVIQRFNQSGDLLDVLWAQGPKIIVTSGEEEE